MRDAHTSSTFGFDLEKISFMSPSILLMYVPLYTASIEILHGEKGSLRTSHTIGGSSKSSLFISLGTKTEAGARTVEVVPYIGR